MARRLLAADGVAPLQGRLGREHRGSSSATGVRCRSSPPIRRVELTARIPHGSGQTYLRELVLVADHTAYHVGQLVLVRQLLGIWTVKRG